MIEDMYTEEVNQQSDQNPSGGGAVKPEITTAAGGAASIGGESAFRITSAGNNPTTTTSINMTDGGGGGGGDHHHLFSSYPSFHGTSSVSLTLGLQQQHQQQPLFASPTMMPHQRSTILLHGEETEAPPLLPYRDLTGSHQLLHEYDLAG
jgi:hypothetical protein